MTIIPTFPLDRVLERARRDSVEFPYLLANHVPMVLVALDRMGATLSGSTNGTRFIAWQTSSFPRRQP